MTGRIVVVGGGAAGLMAAGHAAELGAEVTLVEKTRQLGAKVRLTGNQHCNLTNACSAEEFLTHLVGSATFMRNALARLDPTGLMAFFESLGVRLQTEADGRVFPRSRNAHEVVQALRRYCLAGNVQFRYDSAVTAILGGETVQGVRVGEDTDLSAAAVILCTGGATYPETGSTGDGYRLARSLGHTLSPLRPGLIPLVAEAPFLAPLQGVSLPDVGATLIQEGKTITQCRGALMFAHYGITGPLAFSLSSRLGDALDRGNLNLHLDLFPDMDSAAMDKALQRELARLGRARYHTLLSHLLPRSLAEVMPVITDIPIDQPLHQFTAAQRQRLLERLKRLELTVTGTAPARQGMVTLGGIRCIEVDPRTMASRIVPGLYLAGELLDVAGADSGGYNLQIAFTTGYVAGEGAARAILSAGE